MPEVRVTHPHFATLRAQNTLCQNRTTPDNPSATTTRMVCNPADQPLTKVPGRVSFSSMNDADALLKTIVRHPGDDTPRVVYADWLEENGRAEEAEFLRVQCRLAAAEPTDNDYAELLDRDEELRLWLTAHVPGPRLAFPGGLSVEGGTHWWWQTHRGYPRFLTYDGCERSGTRAIRVLASAIGRAFEAIPTRWLVVGGLTVAQLATLLKQRVLAGLTELTVQLAVSATEADEAARLLANCRHLRNLRGLSLAFPIGDMGCEALACGHWDELEWFSPDTNMLSPAGLRALAGAAWFRRLRKLMLEDGLTSETFEALAQLPAMRRLHTLDLSRNSFTIKSWRTLARTDSFPALAELRLTDGELGESRVEALASANGFSLRVLKARNCAAGPGIGAAFAAASWRDSLRVLDFSGNIIGPGDVKAIAAARFNAIRHLDLSNNLIGAGGLASLAANPTLRGLRSLQIAGSFLFDIPSPDNFDRFLARLKMPDLRHLNLSRRMIGPKAARRLADPKFASLTRLELSECSLTDTPIKSLLRSPTLRGLIQLDLSGNSLTSSPELLTDRTVLPQLASCSLSDNSLTTATARQLRRRPGVRV